jgi:hypothetical protein
MMTSRDQGGLTISRDGGVSWSNPIVFVSSLLGQPIYIDNFWYISMISNKILVSRDNGLTWVQKITPFTSHYFAYVNSTLVALNSGTISRVRIDITSWDGTTLLVTGNETITGILSVTRNVGIGTSTPSYPLHVASGDGSLGALTTSRWFNNTTVLTQSTAYTNDVGIFSSKSIMTGQSVVAYSDGRIKTHIMDIEDDQALVCLRSLKPKTYKYKDVNTRGLNTVYGFIAQEVKEVLDYASYPMSETIPNVYEIASFVTGTMNPCFAVEGVSM